MKKILSLFLASLILVVVLAGCTVPGDTAPAKTDAPKETSAPEATKEQPKEQPKEDQPPAGEQREYAMIMALHQLEFFNDHKNGLADACADVGAKSYFAGPQEWSIEKLVESIDQAAAKKPTGIIVIGQAPETAVAIDRAIESGIPVVVVASDIPSKRLINIGAEYYTGGVKIGEEIAALLGGKGKVLTSNYLSANQPSANALQQGVRDALAKFPDISIVQELDDKADPTVAPTVIGSALQAHPDVNAIIGLDAISAIGAATAVREAGLTGKVIVSSLDRDSATLELIKNGEVAFTFAQKSYVESYLAVKILTDYLDGKLNLVDGYLAAGVNPLPYKIDTGFAKITKDNVDSFIR